MGFIFEFSTSNYTICNKKKIFNIDRLPMSAASIVIPMSAAFIVFAHLPVWQVGAF